MLLGAAKRWVTRLIDAGGMRRRGRPRPLQALQRRLGKDVGRGRSGKVAPCPSLEISELLSLVLSIVGAGGSA